MRLQRVEIRNFRSIEKLDFVINPNCIILVGANEAGKSNILRALSLLSSDVDVNKDDIRDESTDESPIEEAYVRFVFSLENNEINEVFEKLKKYVLGHDKSKIVTIGSNNVDLLGFCKHKEQVLYRINVLKQEKRMSYWNMASNNYKISNSWKRVKENTPSSVIVEFENNKYQLNKYKIVNIKDIGIGSDEILGYLDELSIEVLNDIVGKEFCALGSNCLPEVVLWEYKDKNLLPGRIDIDNFKLDPNICVPLRNMFRISGIYNIEDAINEAETKTNGMRNLLRKIAKNTTKHIRTVWPEKSDISIALNQNGEVIEAGVEDAHNVYDFSRRSEGFKRFVTFLLMISAANTTSELKDALVLIDEPDIGLHPSGAKCLRKELIKISKSNYVVFCTHSIFMIDKEYIGRHRIIKKEKEITTTQPVEESNIKDEEVIYNALGYSMFDNLEKNNIIFEGWRDKSMFRTAIRTKKSSLRIFDKIGTCHSVGVKDIARVASMLDLANRKYVIISDGDKPAREMREKYDEPNKWHMYPEVLNNSMFVTSEDFIDNNVLIKCFNKVLFQHYSIAEIDDSTIGNTGNIIAQIVAQLELRGIEKERIREIMHSFKTELFGTISAKDIKAEYFEFLGRISGLLN